MATAYPARGTSPWDGPLKLYIDSVVDDAVQATDPRIAAVLADPASVSGEMINTTVETQVAEAVEGLAPGIQLAYKEMAYGASGTEVYPTAFNLPPLTLTVVGQGRPVEIEFYVPALYHSVANGGCFGAIFSQITGGSIVYEQVIEHYSPKTDRGPALTVKKTKTLVADTEYTFAFYLGGLVAGTWAGGGSGGSFKTMFSKITAR